MAVWDKQPEETSKAYEAFTRYRDAGVAGRSLRKCSTSSAEYRQFCVWSKENNWVARADAWDMHEEQLRRAEWQKERQEMYRRHAKMAMAFQSKAMEALLQMPARKLTPADAARFLDIASKLERLTRGDVTEAASVEVSGEVDVTLGEAREKVKAMIERLASRERIDDEGEAVEE